KKLTEAAKTMATEPVSVQLRFLQTLTEVSAEKNSTMILPIPIELLRAFETYTQNGGYVPGKEHASAPDTGEVD
ncbi:MAG: slipin family protein, partial [Myxococcota bacterium]|nr:slipin family protein [Myxococcota bacterium]